MFLNSDDDDDFGQNKNNQKATFGRNQQYQPKFEQKTQTLKKVNNPSQNASDLMMINQKPGMNSTYGQGQDINFDQLATILKDDKKNQVYEPGMQNFQKSSGLAPLKSVDQKVTLKEAEYKNVQNLINLKDSDDDEDVQEIQLKDEEKKVDQPQQQQKKQVTNVMKELYGDSSDESKDSEKAHNEVLKNKQNNQNEESDSENDQDEEADKVDQVINNNNQDQQQVNQPLIRNTYPENISMNDVRNFLTQPIQKGVILQMTIRRDKSGFARFYPKYHLCFSGDNRYLMTGKKRTSNKTSNYLMSMSKDNLSKKSPDFLGKVRSNFLGTEFHVYDTGDNPKKCKFPDKIRRELGLIIYESNLLGSRGPRKMKIIIPEIQENGQPFIIKPLSGKEGLLSMFKSGRKDQQFQYFNKPPKWNDSVQAFVLNFNGRVDKPSVKNFQLIDEKNDEHIYLQFGRIGEDAFNLDVQYPFSILQAFGICLSSFDYKIACE